MNIKTRCLRLLNQRRCNARSRNNTLIWCYQYRYPHNKDETVLSCSQDPHTREMFFFCIVKQSTWLVTVSRIRLKSELNWYFAWFNQSFFHIWKFLLKLCTDHGGNTENNMQIFIKYKGCYKATWFCKISALDGFWMIFFLFPSLLWCQPTTNYTNKGFTTSIPLKF